MNREILKKAVRLSENVGYIFLATADRKGAPHVACAKKMELVSNDQIAVTEWFCPDTVRNLNENTHLAVIVWDKQTDKGYQLLGKSLKVEDIAMLDGYVPQAENKKPLPQVERKLSVKIDKILEFKHAPHSDIIESVPG